MVFVLAVALLVGLLVREGKVLGELRAEQVQCLFIHSFVSIEVRCR